jgi:hypothetical protein
MPSSPLMIEVSGSLLLVPPVDAVLIGFNCMACWPILDVLSCGFGEWLDKR